MDSKANIPKSLKGKGSISGKLVGRSSFKKIEGKGVVVFSGISGKANICGIAINGKGKVVNSGINESLCPLILCIDGGQAGTTSFPPVNGLLNGGTP